MFNLYRASQLAFPREEILKNAKDFSYKYLQDKRERDELIDKWIIMKDLPGEVRYVTCNIRPNTHIMLKMVPKNITLTHMHCMPFWGRLIE